MKTLITMLVTTICIQWVAAADIPPWHVIKESARGAKMIKIVEAAYEYETKNGKYPPTLYSLVSDGFLKADDLCLPNPDKSLTVPDYFPAVSTKMRLDLIVIRAPSEDRSYQIIVRNDLSISGVPNQKPAQQDGGGQPATRPESK